MKPNLSEKSELKINSLVFAATGSMFAFFCNPKFRGENFVWDDFPSLCQNHAITWVHGSMPRATDTHIEYAKNAAFLYASSLIKQAGLTK